VLVLTNGGGGLLALAAAAAGAGRVVVVEKWRWGCRASKQLIEANRSTHPNLVEKIQVVTGPLSSCYFEPAGPATTAATAAAVQDTVAEGGAVSTWEDGNHQAGNKGSKAAAEQGGDNQRLAEGIEGDSSSSSEADMVVHVIEHVQGCKSMQAADSLKPGPAAAAAAAGVASEGHRRFKLTRQADVVVTDMFDYRYALLLPCHVCIHHDSCPVQYTCVQCMCTCAVHRPCTCCKRAQSQAASGYVADN
jgi:hypothetical protein